MNNGMGLGQQLNQGLNQGQYAGAERVDSNTIRADIKKRLDCLTKESELFEKLEAQHHERLVEAKSLRDALTALDAPQSAGPTVTGLR